MQQYALHLGRDIPWKGYTDMPQTTGPLNFSLRSKGSDFQGTYFLFLACKYLINRSTVVTTSSQQIQLA